MKQPPNTVPPLVGEPTERRRFLDLFLPESRREKYYEALDRSAGLRLLWMECPRFGVRMAYPCVLEEAGAAPLAFASGSPEEAEENAALIRRWEALDLPSRLDALEITELDRAAFRRKYRDCLRR